MHRTTGSNRTYTSSVQPEPIHSDGDPASGLKPPGTTVTADWLNAIQEELCGVVEASGTALDANDNGQLQPAIEAYREAATTGSPQYYSTGTALTTRASVHTIRYWNSEETQATYFHDFVQLPNHTVVGEQTNSYICMTLPVGATVTKLSIRSKGVAPTGGTGVKCAMVYSEVGNNDLGWIGGNTSSTTMNTGSSWVTNSYTLATPHVVTATQQFYAMIEMYITSGTMNIADVWCDLTLGPSPVAFVGGT